MRGYFLPEVWKKRISYETIGFKIFFKLLRFLISENAFIDLLPCAVSSETLFFPKIPVFGLALFEVPSKANMNEREWCLLNVHKQQRTVGNVFYPRESEQPTRQKTPWWQLCCKKWVRWQQGSLWDCQGREKALSCPSHSLQLQQADVHWGGMGVRPLAFLVQNSNWAQCSREGSLTFLFGGCLETTAFEDLPLCANRWQRGSLSTAASMMGCWWERSLYFQA